jgi:hypothetical protein
MIQATDIAFRDFAVMPLHHQFNVEAMRTTMRHQPRQDGRVLPADIHPGE